MDRLLNIDVIQVNSFTADGKGGNPAAVVFNADKLSNAQKLKIAQTVGYSETAFVSSDESADYEVSFFTTTSEIDFCGHATLAVFSTLFKIGMLTAGVYVQRTKAGLLSVSIASNGKVIMEQPLPQKLGCFSYQLLANVIGIDRHLLASTNLPIEAISTGLADVLIAVPTGHLDTIQPNDALISDFCKEHNVVGLHVFERCDAKSKLTASCRNFAPLVGIHEESATGSASGALACYLTEHLGLGADYVFEQGRAMNCTSLITASVTTSVTTPVTISVTAKNTEIMSVKVGGFSSHIGSMNVSL